MRFQAPHTPLTHGNIITISHVRNIVSFTEIKWWATLESNQACVSARELQSPATPCGLSPTADQTSGPRGQISLCQRLVNIKNA